MRFSVRRLVPGELDHELIWLSVSVLSLGLAAMWLTMGLPWPRCVFHDLTQLPCVTCGMTRCGIQFFHGHFLAALQWNPFVFTILCGRHCIRCIRPCSTHCAHAATADSSFDAACENDLASLSHLCARAELDLFAAALAQFLKALAVAEGADLGFGNHVAYRRGRRPRLQLQNLCPSVSICG